MTSRYKKPRPLVRDQRTLRDANLLVIATEDTYLPAQYFDLFRNPRVKVQVLPTEDCRSSPEHVMDRLASFTREYQLADDDELWLMLDTDHWIGANHIATFANACTQAMKSGVGLAHSNPCFETLAASPRGGFEHERRVRKVCRRLPAGPSSDRGVWQTQTQSGTLQFGDRRCSSCPSRKPRLVTR